ncbi:hypothetical protein AB835_02755 [Candidatus Endobugula sertula]|uniref:Uncharacterized protein n=1 Tax=Candidatus Endobugula sertula TaxID=62101 RepID=A0A1D2QSX9_9GAMM|nr:hypothetical protein AB835_02755 [Candidatus Endobugula sertula]
MEAIFVASGYIVNFMGGALAILLIAFLLLYCCGFAFYERNINWHSSRPAILSLLTAAVLTILLTAVFAITAVVLGAWG